MPDEAREANVPKTRVEISFLVPEDIKDGFLEQMEEYVRDMWNDEIAIEKKG